MMSNNEFEWPCNSLSSNISSTSNQTFTTICMQRLDVYNGLLLIPNLDKLFDKGYISFDDNGIIILSDFLPLSDYRLLGVQQGMRLVHIETNHIPYLKFHRENCLL